MITCKRFLLAFLVVVYSLKALGIERPTIAKKGISYEEQIANINVKDYLKNDNNFGAFTHSVSIPLNHKLPGLRHKLKLTYNSQSGINLSMGYGFNWNLPQLIRVKNHPRAAMLIQDEYGLSELIEKGDNFYELGLNSFVRIERTQEGFQAQYPNGISRIFNLEGLLVSEFHRLNSHSLNYSWKGGRLEKITISSGEAVTFNYQDCSYNQGELKNEFFGRYYKRRWYDKFKCLKDISYSNYPHKLTFDYQLNNLISISWDGNKDQEIFHGDYSSNFHNGKNELTESENAHDRIFGTPSQNTMAFTSGENAMHFAKEGDLDPLIGWKKIGTIHRPNDDGGNYAHIVPIDLNGDRITDYLAFAVSRDKAETEQVIHFGLFHDTDFRTRGNWHSQRVEAYISNGDGSLSFNRASKFDLGSDFFILNTIHCIDHGDGKVEMVGDVGKYRMEALSVLTYTESRVHTGDFNGDGHSDIVVCGAKQKVAYNTGKGFKAKSLSINCPRESLSFDFNQDGIQDILTKTTLFFGGPNGFKQISEIPQYLKDIQNDIETNEYGLEDLDMDGIVTQRNKDSLKFFTDFDRDGEPELWSKGTRFFEVKKTFPKRGLLTKITLPSNGTISVDYDILNSQPVIQSISADNLNTEPTVYNYKFHHPQFDVDSHSFFGFSIMERIRQQTPSIEGSKEYLQFFVDPLGKNNKERQLGFSHLVSKTICSPERCADAANRLYNGDYGFNWHIHRSITRRYIPVQKLTGYPQQDLRQYFLAPYKDKSNLLEPAQGHFAAMGIVSSKNITHIFNRFSYLGPIEYVVKNAGHGLENFKLNYDDVVDYLRQEHFEFTDFKGVKLPKSKKVFSTGRNYSKYLSSENNYEYSELDSGGYQVKKYYGSMNDPLLEEVVEMKGGYPRSFRASNGKHTLSLNDDNGFLVESNLSSRAKETFERDGLGRVLKHEIHSDSGTQKYSYSYQSNGKVKSITYPTFKIELSSISEPFGKTSKVFYKTIAGEELKIEEYFYDGFNRLLKATNQEGKSVFVTSHGKWSPEGMKLSETYSTLNSERDDSDIDFTYDFFDRVHSRQDNILNRNTTYKFKGNSIKKQMEGKVVDSKRTIFTGEPMLYFRDGDVSPIGYDADIKINSLNKRYYKRDVLGNITSSYKEGFQSLYQKFDYNANIVKRTNESFVLNALGQLTQINLLEEGDEFFYQYDDLGRFTGIQGPNISSTLAYDVGSNLTYMEITSPNEKPVSITYVRKDMGDLERLNIKFGNHYFSHNYTFTHDKLVQTDNFSISRDGHGNISGVDYGKLQVSYIHSPNGELTNWSIEDYQETINRNSVGRISNIKSNINLSKKFESLPKGQRSFSYTRGLKLMEPAPSKGVRSTRDKYGNLDAEGIEYYRKGERVREIEKQEVRYRDDQSILSVGKEKYYTNDIHVIDGHLIHYLIEGGKTFGATVSGDEVNGFFPIVTDFRGSVRMIYSSEGKLLTIRNHSAWGELNEQFTDHPLANKIDRLIRKDFAHLIRPYKSKYLISKSRIYAAEYGQWLSIDPLLLWKPDVLVEDHLEEIDGFKYAGGDPLNFVDPSGHSAILAAGLVMGGTALVSGVATVYANYRAGRPLMTNLNKIAAITAAPVAIVSAPVVMPALINASFHVGTSLALNPNTTASLAGVTNAVLDRTFGLRTGFPAMHPYIAGAEFLTNQIYKYADSFNLRDTHIMQDDGFRFYEHSSVGSNANDIIGDYWNCSNPYGDGE